MALIFQVKHGELIGKLIQPRHFSEDWNGDFVGVSLPIITLRARGRWMGDHVELTTGPGPDQDRSAITLADPDHLRLSFFHGTVPDWNFERLHLAARATVASDWPAYVSDPEVVSIRRQLRSMADADKQAREKRYIDQAEINRLSDESRPLLQQIYSVYGWPKISVFDAQTAKDYWLLIQHQPLEFQEQVLPSMKTAAESGEATKRDYAYLFDRVEVEQGKPQHWGTQSRCDEKKAVLYSVDDDKNLEQLRKQVGLEPVADSLRAVDAMCKRLP